MRLSARFALLGAALALTGFWLAGNFNVGVALAVGMLTGVIANQGLTRVLSATQGLGAAGFGFASILKLGALTIAAITVGGVIGHNFIPLTLLGMAATQISLALSASYALVRAK